MGLSALGPLYSERGSSRRLERRLEPSLIELARPPLGWVVPNLAGARSHPVKRLPQTFNEGRVTMTPNQLASAARNLAYGLGIPVYVRDGRIYQNGPGLAFLPPNG